MALYKIDALYPNYRESFFQGDDIKGMNVFAGRTDEKIGTVDNVLVDEAGHFRYLIIDTASWRPGKKVLLPIGRSHIDTRGRRVYAKGLTQRNQVESLPPYESNTAVDYNYEEQVRFIYRSMPSVEDSVPVEMSLPVDASSAIEGGMRRPAAPRPVPQPEPVQEVVEQPTYTYEREPDLYTMNDRDHQQFKLYEERLVAHKKRQKVGEVVVKKQVATETEQVSVPVERERIVVEINEVNSPDQSVAPARGSDFDSGEVARMDVYEETADIHKQPVVREEINIRKEVVQDTVDVRETVRREELDIDKRGNPSTDDRNRI